MFKSVLGDMSSQSSTINREEVANSRRHSNICNVLESAGSIRIRIVTTFISTMASTVKGVISRRGISGRC